MFKVGDKVVIKNLETLLEDGDLEKAEDLGNVYHNKDKKFVIFPDFHYFNEQCTVDEVHDDPDVPYFLSIGIWVPEFMIVADKPKIAHDIAEDPKDAIINMAEVADKPNEVVHINKFNNKPFGKLFNKLINLDPKIAEFSNTTFNKLKKHELQYIAKILQDNGREAVDYNKLTQKELAIYCYKETVQL